MLTGRGHYIDCATSVVCGGGGLLAGRVRSGVIAMRQQQHNCTNSHFAELHLMTVVFEVM